MFVMSYFNICYEIGYIFVSIPNEARPDISTRADVCLHSCFLQENCIRMMSQECWESNNSIYTFHFQAKIHDVQL